MTIKKGKEIRNLPEEHDGFKVFHAGTEYVDGDIKSNGGRVLCITALGEFCTIRSEKVLKTFIHKMG